MKKIFLLALVMSADHCLGMDKEEEKLTQSSDLSGNEQFQSLPSSPESSQLNQSQNQQLIPKQSTVLDQLQSTPHVINPHLQYSDYSQHWKPIVGDAQIPQSMLSDEIWHQNHQVQIQFANFIPKQPSQNSLHEALRNFKYIASVSNQKTITSRHSNAFPLFLSFYRNGAAQHLEKEDVKILLEILKINDEKGSNKIDWLLQDDAVQSLLAQKQAIKFAVSNNLIRQYNFFFNDYQHKKTSPANFIQSAKQSKELGIPDKTAELEHLEAVTNAVRPHIEEEYQQKIDSRPFYKKLFFWKTAIPTLSIGYILGKYASSTVENSFLRIQRIIISYIQTKKDAPQS